MLNPTPPTIYLKDYRPPEYLIGTVELHFDLRADHTEVRARLELARNPANPNPTLMLDGAGLELREIAIDGRPLLPAAYRVDHEHLWIEDVPERFVLTTVVWIYPEKNTQLMGLFASRDGYFTQCEAEGFRRITYFLDRPDVMSRYTTTIQADKARFSNLLSNGNQTAAGDAPDGRHWARWVDPFPKPSYLFAMVAAKLDVLEDRYTTGSGREVKLFVFVEPGRLDQCSFAMSALKSAMRWDESVFGLELDLDQYMIVAVSDFNMGAMENKGLNIFNTRYVLARADLATDYDYMMLDRVIAHEYFHNWTGNRVTCRDWFQLSLKEGLTVFRDQQYGGDRYSHAVQRIQEVRSLRASQFPEDAGPMAHPVRPAAYMEISNFYTATVYNKGAEVVRMIHTLLGADGFRCGMDLYFARHDGHAVCTEDFVRAMQDATNVDLTKMQQWYDQAGTPTVRVSAHYDAALARYSLRFTQSCSTAPAQHAFPIPIALGLLDRMGAPIMGAEHQVFVLEDIEQTLVFENLSEQPVPSLLRGFSAPVNLLFDYSDDELANLMAHDRDPFNRWEAGQRLASTVLLRGVDAYRAGRTPEFSSTFVAACGRLLGDAEVDPAFAAEALSLPGASTLAEQMEVVDPDALLAMRTSLRKALACELRGAFEQGYQHYEVRGLYDPEPVTAGRRALRNLCLGYLMELEEPAIYQRCFSHFTNANNMTDAIAALSALANTDCSERAQALTAFYAKWRNEPLVVDKWLTVQATSRLPGTLNDVRRLLGHEAFSLTNPNKVRALIGAFCQSNHAGFHAADGSGYRFAMEQILALDPINPQIAARLTRAFDRWRKFDPARQHHAQAALEQVRNTPSLSKDTTEVVTRLL
ncbi:MAG: aminopeptidase N [Gammaproteobacteria bacterium]|nr:aminopeptidase N [Gammaproteobacteria bacterium]